MTYETISCLHDNGFEVIVDLSTGMDAICGRGEFGSWNEADFTSAVWTTFTVVDGAVRRAAEVKPAGDLRYDGRRQSR